MRTYFVHTFGCQMNKHDSERVAGLMEADGYLVADEERCADVIIFNTCCVRERAEERFRGYVASLSGVRQERDDMIIAVGGCIAQNEGERLTEDLPIDVVFGTHNIHELPDLIEDARARKMPATSIHDRGESFANDLPSRRDVPWKAWLPITVGCDNRCSYCIVPYVRGPERSRTLEQVVEEATALVADGVLEITLLGQNVNSYGRDLYGEPRFSQVLQAVADCGVEWIRFATSHPKDLSDRTIAAIRDIDQVCAALHLPVQSGSTRILQAMGRSYTKDSYLALVERLRDEIPHIALSTDVMVGFPGETEEDFQDTMDVVEACAFDQAFTFIFSPRVGTPAASMDGQVDRDVSQVRFDRLVDQVNLSARTANAALVGTCRRVLVEGPSRRDPSVLTGRTGSNKVVHTPVPPGSDASDHSGTFMDIEIDASHNWFLEGTIRASNG